MPPEDTRLVVYEKLYSFLQTLNHSSEKDREAVNKLLGMYQANPAKTLALLNTLLFSNASGENLAHLNPDLIATLQAESVAIPLVYYS